MDIRGSEPWGGFVPSLLNARLLYKPANELEPPLVFTEPWVEAGKGQLDLSNPGSRGVEAFGDLSSLRRFTPCSEISPEIMAGKELISAITLLRRRPRVRQDQRGGANCPGSHGTSTAESQGDQTGSELGKTLESANPDFNLGSVIYWLCHLR